MCDPITIGLGLGVGFAVKQGQDARDAARDAAKRAEARFQAAPKAVSQAEVAQRLGAGPAGGARSSLADFQVGSTTQGAVSSSVTPSTVVGSRLFSL